MFRKNKILPLVEQTPTRSRPSAAVDHIAAFTGIFVVALGVAQLIAPVMTAPLTGIEPGTAADVLGLQWAALGAVLTLGGFLRTRVVTIFAAEFILISALAALTILAIELQAIESLLIHGAMAVIGFLNSGFARLSDKAELKRDLRLMREHASIVRERDPAAEGDSPNA